MHVVKLILIQNALYNARYKMARHVILRLFKKNWESHRDNSTYILYYTYIYYNTTYKIKKENSTKSPCLCNNIVYRHLTIRISMCACYSMYLCIIIISSQ